MIDNKIDDDADRKFLYGRSIGEWVLLRGVNGNSLGYGRIERVDKKNGTLTLKTPQRYELTENGFKEELSYYESTVRLEIIGIIDTSTEGEAWGNTQRIPSMEYLGREVSIEGRMGIISVVRPGSTILKPYIGDHLTEDGDSQKVVVDDDLIVTRGLDNIIPLRKSLEDIVRIQNETKNRKE